MEDLKTKYTKEIIPFLKKEFSYDNDLAVPRLVKVVVSAGTGEALREKATKTVLVETMAAITGQKPKMTHAKAAIAGFKIREGMPIGLKVTLRKKRMYDFITRLVDISLPRVRDFRGLSAKSFDGKGNYNIGITEHTVFPEAATGAKSERTFGLQITVVTTAKNNEEGLALCKALGFPIK